MPTAQKTQPTTFDKLERYVTKIADEYGATIEKSPRSRYFKFNDRVLRLSNHIGKNSSGAISIIVPYGTTSKDDVFILHVHSTGNIQTLNMQQVKEFIRTFAVVSDFLEPLINSSSVAYVQQQQTTNKTHDNNTILGYPTSYFTEGQINQIRLFIQQNKITHQ